MTPAEITNAKIKCLEAAMTVSTTIGDLVANTKELMTTIGL